MVWLAALLATTIGYFQGLRLGFLPVFALEVLTVFWIDLFLLAASSPWEPLLAERHGLQLEIDI